MIERRDFLDRLEEWKNKKIIKVITESGDVENQRY